MPNNKDVNSTAFAFCFNWSNYTILDLLCRFGPSVSISCPLYNSFTDGRISFKHELRIEFHSGCIYWIMNAMVKLANP